MRPLPSPKLRGDALAESANLRPAKVCWRLPAGGPLRVGTLAAILSDVAEHQGITRADLEERLFG